MSKLFLILGILMVLGSCYATRDKPVSDLCLSIPNQFQGFTVCGEAVKDLTEVERRFPALMIELGSSVGTLSLLSLPDANGNIQQLGVLTTQLNLTFCPNIGGFYHRATVYQGRLTLTTVESVFFPLATSISGADEPSRFCEVRKGDAQSFGANINRLSISNGRNIHAHVGRDRYGNIIDVVFNVYPDDYHTLAFSFTNNVGSKLPQYFIVSNLTHIQ